MLIYLKVWESDLFIKRLYQFARIINNEHYDWYFKISESSRDRTSNGTRQNIIRSKIKDRFKIKSPIIYNLLKNTYNTQIRNSIAHSNYSFLNRYIHLNNFIKSDPFSQNKSITFDEWINIFHSTLILHNLYIGMISAINERYLEIAKLNGNVLKIMVTESSGKQYELPLEYHPDSDNWIYKF